MHMSFFISLISTFILALLGMAFFTLLERKALAYFQLRKGPNKVSISGVPQPFADAIKLFTKEQAPPHSSNKIPFFATPIISLSLALLLWSIFPFIHPNQFFKYGVVIFLCISSLNVYSTLAAGWSSNSKYALLGALRSVAQTISYEVSMALILLCLLLFFISFNMSLFSKMTFPPMLILLFPMFIFWFITTLAETNRTPFDLAEGESELVSGFNVEYGSSMFALIFMAEYTSILIMSIITSILFMNTSFMLMPELFFSLTALLISFSFLWVRATLPRMRYDQLMNLTWKTFLPITLTLLMLIILLVSV